MSIIQKSHFTGYWCGKNSNDEGMALIRKLNHVVGLKSAKGLTHPWKSEIRIAWVNPHWWMEGGSGSVVSFHSEIRNHKPWIKRIGRQVERLCHSQKNFSKKRISKSRYDHWPITNSQLLLYKYNKLWVTPYTRGDVDAYWVWYINTHFGTVLHLHTSHRFLNIFLIHILCTAACSC